jgi:hypothetical protein
MSFVNRKLLVIAGLSIAGTLAGAAAVALPLMALLFGISSGGPSWIFVAFGAIIGGVLGGIVGPLFAWVWLPEVPLGKVITRTFLGTLTGGALGWLTFHPLAAAVGAIVGFLVAAAQLAPYDPNLDDKPGTVPTRDAV